MILSTHGIVGSISGIDADWLAYYNRVIAAGGSLSTTEQNATKTLVADLKSAGIWSAMKAIYPMVGASAAACAQNLKSSSFTGSFTSTGWTFASTGVTPNGTSAFFNSNLVPNTSLTANSSHLSYYSRTQSILTSQLEMGCWNTGYTNGIEFGIYRDNTFITQKTYGQLNSPNSNKVETLNTNTQGLYTLSRTSNSSFKYYKNSSTIATNTNTTTSVAPSFNLYIGGSNEFGTATAFSNRQCAFASIGDGLTDTQASNLYTAVQAFQTTLSRQV
jgi:hypothetical protein